MNETAYILHHLKKLRNNVWACAQNFLVWRHTSMDVFISEHENEH